jgi:hypothetical protein
MIERDKVELDKCLENKLCKSGLILSGSIIEAIIVDCFLALPELGKTTGQVLKASLAELIDWALDANLISKRSKDLSTVIRDYRNLIHPGKEYRLKEQVDFNSLNVAVNLVEIVVQEISRNYSERLGYTADQAIKKVFLDPDCSSIFPHLVDQMSRAEKIKLFRSIPAKAMEDETTNTDVRNLLRLHDLLCSNVGSEIIQSEARRMYSCFQNQTKWEALFNLRFFYDHLSVLDDDQLDAILSYILGVLGSADEDELETLNNNEIYRCGKYFNTPVKYKLLRGFIFNNLRPIEISKSSGFMKMIENLTYYVDEKYVDQLVQELSKSHVPTAKIWADEIRNFFTF